MNSKKDIPVYIVSGFLESGKTTFVNQTLSNPAFLKGGKVLFISCEDGLVEVDEKGLSKKGVTVEHIENEEDLSPEKFAQIQEEIEFDKVLIEYNGMWLFQNLYEAFPDNWMIEMQMNFFDSTTFLLYNQNMRQLVVDKIQTSDSIVFNRVPQDESYLEFHKIVRGVSRTCPILYENVEGKVFEDDIEDPLPYDIEAETIIIEDRDYAIFYRDLCEDMAKYDGKKVKFKAIVARDRSLNKNELFVGRHVMTCCVEDIQYNPMVCDCMEATRFKDYDWIVVEGRIKVKYHSAYKMVGPTLIADRIVNSGPPLEEVATFY